MAARELNAKALGARVGGMAAQQDIESLGREELIELVRAVVSQNEELRAIIEEQRKRIDELTRAGKRQASPFSKGKPKQNPKRPGRKPGQGAFTNRTAPADEEITEPDVEVPVTDQACPECGGGLEADGTQFAYRTEIEKLPKPIVTRYVVAVCRCRECGARVRGRHPDVAEDQYGATAHRLGPRLLAWAHVLHHQIGVPVRRVPVILREGHGVRVTQSAITQSALRLTAGVVGHRYAEIRAGVTAAKAVYTDDTSWRVGGSRAHLMGFETDEASVYQIRPRHRNEEVREVVPEDYAGTMVTDRGRSYDAVEFNAVKQQKCLGHVGRSLTEALEGKRGKARWFGTRLKELLKEATAQWDAVTAGKITRRTYTREGQRIKQELDTHLRERVLKDEDNRRLLYELGRHHDRGNLVRFLDDPTIEPYNYRAERGLRGPIIARKVSHCSKTWPGAESYAAFVSVIRTGIKQGASSMVDTLYDLFRSAKPQDASP
jgi:transposase